MSSRAQNGLFETQTDEIGFPMSNIDNDELSFYCTALGGTEI